MYVKPKFRLHAILSSLSPFSSGRFVGESPTTFCDTSCLQVLAQPIAHPKSFLAQQDWIATATPIYPSLCCTTYLTQTLHPFPVPVKRFVNHHLKPKLPRSFQKCFQTCKLNNMCMNDFLKNFLKSG